MKKLLAFSLLIAIVVATLAAPTAQAQDDSANVTLWFSDDFSYSVGLPEGWAATTSDVGILIANSEAALDIAVRSQNDEDLAFESGMIGIAVLAFPTASLPELGLAEDSSEAEIVGVIQQIAAEQNAADNPRFGDIIEFELWGRDVAAVDSQTDRNDSTIVTYTFAPGHIAIVNLGFAVNEGATLGSDAFGVLGTVRFSPPLEATFEEAGYPTFNYPEGWIASADETGIAFIGSDESALSVDTFDDEQFAILVADLGALGFVPSDVEDAASQMMDILVDTTAGDVASEPVLFEIDDEGEISAFAFVDITNEDLGLTSAIVIRETADGEFFLVSYGTNIQDSYQMGLLAINMLLSATAE